MGDDERKAGGATVKTHSKFDIPEQLVQRFIQVETPDFFSLQTFPGFK